MSKAVYFYGVATGLLIAGLWLTFNTFSYGVVSDVTVIGTGQLRAEVKGWPVKQLTKPKLLISKVGASLQKCSGGKDCPRVPVKASIFKSEITLNDGLSEGKSFLYLSVNCPLTEIGTHRNGSLNTQPIEGLSDYYVVVTNYFGTLRPVRAFAKVPDQKVCD